MQIKAKRNAKLERMRVIRSALKLLNRVGMEGLTLRRLATDLRVQAPALYWHFQNKQALIDAMATTMMRDLLDAVSLPSDQPWQEWLRDFAIALRRMLLGYRDGARLFSGTAITDNDVLALMEAPLRKLTNCGFVLPDAARVWSTVYCFVVGFTLEEQAILPLGKRDKRFDTQARKERVDPARYPLVAALGSGLLEAFEERFLYGLQMVIAGASILKAPPGERAKATGERD